MIEELNNQYTEMKNVIDLLPVNNKANRKRKKEFLEKEIENDNGRIKDVAAEIEKRLAKYNDLKRNPEIEKITKDIQNCNIIDEWNTFNSSYEKMRLDFYLYRLSKYYKEDLQDVNDCIRTILDAFKKVGITLKKEDFNYDDLAMEYMQSILDNKSDTEIKSIFEKVYWKNSNIIKIIELNFKSIYFKYEKSIDKYYEERHKAFLKEHKDDEIYNLRINLYQQLYTLIDQDSYTNFQKFINKEYTLNDYKDIDKIKTKYFHEQEYKIEKLKELLSVLHEYKVLLDYKYIFDDMKEKLDKKDTFKNNMQNTIKQINKEEKKLISLNKKKNKKNLFGKVKNNEKWLFDYKTVIDNLNKAYEELDNTSFDNKVFTKLSKDSTILDTLKLVCSNYLYFINKTYELDNNQIIEDLNKKFEDIKKYIYSNYFYFINNISLLDEKQMKEMICNKYNLENIYISNDDLLPESISNTINDIKRLIDNENFIKSNINLEDISLYLEYKNE